MLYRKIYQIKNSQRHIIGFYYAVSKEEVENAFLKHPAPPFEVINEFWKTAAYCKIFDDKDYRVEEFKEYKITPSDNNKDYCVEFEDENFNDDGLYENMEFKPEEPCLIRIVKLYTRRDKYSKEGRWAIFNDEGILEEIVIQNNDEFPSHYNKAYFYFIKME